MIDIDLAKFIKKLVNLLLPVTVYIKKKSTTLQTSVYKIKTLFSRYGLSNCEDQLQGIQTGEKTASQVLADQEHLITELLEKYEITHKDRVSSMQGLQDQASAFPDINSPCPQGVQGII